MERLLRLPLQPDQAEEQGTTALMSAAGGGHLEVAQLLCEAGADTDKATVRGTTALMLC